jgi:hypothetical protein
VHRLHDRARRRPAGGLGDEALDLVLAEPAQRQPPPVAADLGDQLADRGVEARLDLAVGADHQHAAAAQLARDEAEQQQGRPVGGVEVVERDDERLLLAGRLEEAGDGVEQGEPRVVRLQVRRGLQVGQPLGDARHDLGEVAGARPEPARELAGRHRTGERADRLHPRPVGRGSAVLPAASPGNHRAGAGRGAGRPLDESRLPDARLAADEERPAAPGARRLERAEQLVELPIAPDEELVRSPSRWTPHLGPDSK